MSLNNPFWGLKSNSKVATKVLINASKLEGVKKTRAFSKVALIWNFYIKPIHFVNSLQDLHFLKKGSFSPNLSKLARADIRVIF